MTLPEPISRGSARRRALRRRVRGGWLAWDDPSATGAADTDALRSTWNYASTLRAFPRVDRPAQVVWNPRRRARQRQQRYLLALAARGVPAVPTTIVELGQEAHVRERS